MRIAIDATPLLLRSAGVKTYVWHLATHLRRLAGAERVRLFPFLREPGQLHHEGSALGRAATLARLIVLNAANAPGVPLLDWYCRGIDLFHATNVHVVKRPRRVRVSATIHDMTCWVTPETHTPENVAVNRRFAERLARHADGLIADSHATREDVIRILNYPAERIEVIHPGVADAYFQVPAEAVQTAREKHGLKRPYLLFVGTVEPRKNLERLLDAYGKLKASVREEYELVVAGAIGWSVGRTAERLRAGAPGVRYLGYVPEADLPGVTAGAAAFVFPSLYEGFGFPVAQAMAAGVPAITSNVSSLPEVAGDAALLVDPRSVEELRRAMEELLLSEPLRARLGERGKQRAREFRWETAARKTLDFFERVAGR